MIVRTARDAAGLLEPLLASAEEGTVAIIYLDEEQRLIETAVEPPEGAGAADLPLRAIFARALRLGARSLVVACNRPNGDRLPSEADLTATRELAAAGRRLDVILHDRLFFAAGEWRSFRALGLL